MTKTGYMTVEAWEELAPKMAEGLRSAPIVRDMPHWWMMKIVDGFGPHVSSLAAMTSYGNKKILLMKEEGDASHVNQAYDQSVAKDDKVTMRHSLTYLRKCEKLSKTLIDGWDLVHVGLAAVRELSPNSWVASFKRVNLHPKFRVDFTTWCKRISGFLQGGDSFKRESSLVDTYRLLPAFWHGMDPVDKKRCAEILASHEDAYTSVCVLQLHDQVNIPLADMQNLRVCLELASSNPEHLDRMLPDIADDGALPNAVVTADAARCDVADGLTSFQVHPTKNGVQLLTGLAKFEHLIKLTARSTSAVSTLAPSKFLDVEMTSVQQKLLNPSATDYMMHEIMAQAHGAGAQQNLAKRKLDALGNLRGECGFANDPTRMKRLKAQIDLATSLAEISRATTKDATAKRLVERRQLTEAAPEAINKLKHSNLDPMKITKKQICAIAFTNFGGLLLKEAEGKQTLADKLSALMAEQPAIVGPATTSTRQPPPAKPKSKPKPTPTPTNDDSSNDDDNDDDDDAAAAADDDDDHAATDDDDDEDEDEEDGSGDDDSPPLAITTTATDSSDDDMPPVKLKLGEVVHIPASAFPNEELPEGGFWVGKTVKTKKGGEWDIGILVPGEKIFTRPMAEVASWLV